MRLDRCMNCGCILLDLINKSNEVFTRKTKILNAIMCFFSCNTSGNALCVNVNTRIPQGTCFLKVHYYLKGSQCTFQVDISNFWIRFSKKRKLFTGFMAKS